MKRPLRLSKIWNNAAEVAAGAMSRADATVMGTERARQRYQKMSAEMRSDMEREVTRRYGKSAWSDFVAAVGGRNG